MELETREKQEVELANREPGLSAVFHTEYDNRGVLAAQGVKSILMTLRKPEIKQQSWRNALFWGFFAAEKDANDKPSLSYLLKLLIAKKLWRWNFSAHFSIKQR